MENFGLDFSAILRPGVYFLFWRGEVVYVGQSQCPLVRLYTHQWKMRRRQGFAFDGVRVLPTHRDELLVAETRWIKELQPRHNEVMKEPLVKTKVDVLGLLGIQRKPMIEFRL